MIVLDTNVVSETIKLHPEPLVVNWLNRQAKKTLYLTAISLSELLFGIELLDEGRRKREMAQAVQQLLDERFVARVLPFDTGCAATYASLMSHARHRGLAVAISDGQIAAIAKAHGFAVATRDRGPFEAAGLKVIDPWQA